MSTFESVDAVLDFAISKEEEAAAYYLRLAGRVEKAWMADVFKGFAREEEGHKARLEAVRKGGRLEPSAGKVQDLKIADYTADVEERDNMTYQDALVLAMKREKAAFRLYTDLAEAVDDEDLKSTFLALSQEEAKHKLRIEVTYDELILTDN